MKIRERTFLMVKPDGVQRGLVGNVVGRMEQKGLKLVAMKMLHLSMEIASRHYGEHEGKPFYEGLIDFITSAPVVAMIWEGDDAIAMIRSMVGATDPRKSEPGSIRGDLAVFTGKNVVHASDSLTSAEREIALFFSEDDICPYEMPQENCLYD